MTEQDDCPHWCNTIHDTRAEGVLMTLTYGQEHELHEAMEGL